MGLNLQGTESIFGDWFNWALQQVGALLGKVVSDSEDPNNSDLGVNIMLRSNIPDETHALVVDLDQLGMDAVLFQGHDRLTESKIILNQIKLLGLDTLTRFEAL